MIYFYYALVFVSCVVVLVSTQSATICDEARLHTFLPDVRDCTAWVFCGLQGLVRGKCLNQYLFNPKTRLCDWPRNVDCFKCPSNVGLHQIPINGSCRSFIRCLNGILSQNICENGLQFNKITGQCDLPHVVQCQSGFRCPEELPSDGTITATRDNYNCSVYHLCIGGSEALRQECNPELHFDHITNLCTYPNLTNCPISQHPSGPGEGPGNPETEYESNFQTTPTTEMHTDSPTEVSSTELSTNSPTSLSTQPYLTESQTEFSSTNGPEPLFECPYDGIHPHPTECSEYFICAGNMPHHMKCAEMLHFNVAILQCDFPENANCDFYNSIV